MIFPPFTSTTPTIRFGEACHSLCAPNEGHVEECSSRIAILVVRPLSEPALTQQKIFVVRIVVGDLN
jgi:hypothetical protein